MKIYPHFLVKELHFLEKFASYRSCRDIKSIFFSSKNDFITNCLNANVVESFKDYECTKHGKNSYWSAKFAHFHLFLKLFSHLGTFP